MSRFCASCGTQVVPGAVFCTSCGQRIIEPQKVCPTCGQIWPQPATSLSAPNLANLPAPSAHQALSQMPPPMASNTNPTNFKAPVYGENFVEGLHCGNCGSILDTGSSTCADCGTNDVSKFPGATIKVESI